MPDRQTYFRLVASFEFEKVEQTYKWLCECINRARRARLITFHSIRDNDVHIVTSRGYDSQEEKLESVPESLCTVAQYFHFDHQQGQKQRPMIIVEAAGMKPQIEDIADDYGVPVIASGGLRLADCHVAQKLGRLEDMIVLHMGGHYPSGVHVFTQGVEALIADLPGRVTVSTPRRDPGANRRTQPADRAREEISHARSGCSAPTIQTHSRTASC
jgi:hypothetical protein